MQTQTWAYSIAKPRTDHAKTWPESRRVWIDGETVAHASGGQTYLCGKACASFDQAQYGEPVDLGDGVVFYPPIDPSSLALGSLLRKGVPYPMEPVALSLGGSVSVPVASAAPRAVSFRTRVTTGEQKGALFSRAVISARAFDALATLTGKNPDAARSAELEASIAEAEIAAVEAAVELIEAALIAAYHVTPELLDAMGLITDADLIPLSCAIIGLGGKKKETQPLT